MQQALGDGADLQQHLQTAASLGAYAQQLQAQQQSSSGGGTVTTTAGSAPTAAAQENGMAARGTDSDPARNAGPSLRQHPSHGPLAAGPDSSSSSAFGGGGPTQGVTPPPPPGHHAWRVTSERQFQQQGVGAGAGSPSQSTASSATANSWQGPRPARLAMPPSSPASAAAAAPRFPIDYSPLPQAAAGGLAHHVPPRRFFGDASCSEIQPADETRPPEPSMRFLHPPGPGFGGLSRAAAPQRRGETYAEVSCVPDEEDTDDISSSRI